MKKNYLLSHPRSGNSFFRYCIEKITARPTMGCKEGDPNKDGPMYLRPSTNIVIEDKTPAIYKEHFWKDIPIDEEPNIILIIRNPVHSFHSHALRGRTSRNNIEKYGYIFAKELMNNLEQFHQYNGRKIVFHYEDLLSNVKLEFILHNTLHFLDTSYLEYTHEENWFRLTDFLFNIEKERKNSLKAYHAGEIKKPKLDEKIPLKWMEYLEQINAEVYNLYLKHYQIKG